MDQWPDLPGRTGGGNGFSCLNFGSWGLWQCTQSRYCLSPFQLPVRLPWTPTFQSLSLSPWHWPHSLYDSAKSSRSPETSRNLSRFSRLWQSVHQRCPSAWCRTISVWYSVRTRRLGLGFKYLWHCVQGKIPSENGGPGTAKVFSAGRFFMS